MAGGLREKTIASSLVLFDTRVTDVDHYLNVRDLQVFRENHNLLLAERTRQPLVHQVWFDGYDSNPSIKTLEAVSTDRLRGHQAFYCRVELPPAVKELTLNVRAGFVDAAGGNVYLYPVLDGPTERRELDKTNEVITINATAETKYTIDVPVSNEAQRAGYGSFYIYVETPMYGTDLKADGAITAVGGGTQAWIQSASAPTVGDVAYFKTGGVADPTYLPRIIKSIVGTQQYFDGPWVGPIPVAGTQQVNYRSVNTCRIWSLTLYPKEVTDFDEVVDT